MKVPLHARLGATLGVFWLVVASACQSTNPPVAPTSVVLRQPQSSLAALVRALEVLDAVRDPRGYVRIRAVECDSILDRSAHTEYARVLLDLTVYSHDAATARAVFEDLARTLEDEAAAPNRVDIVPRTRAMRVFQAMNWSADGLPQNALSYSEVLRLEMKRGRHLPLPELDEFGSPTPAAPRQTQPVDEYVRAIAEGSDTWIGPVTTYLRVAQPSRNTRDMRVHIKPESPDAHFTKEQIGAFLSELEAHSPLARITRVEIQRVPHLPLWNAENGWTFEAILTLRVGSS
jgi:hypothetical protein